MYFNKTLRILYKTRFLTAVNNPSNAKNTNCEMLQWLSLLSLHMNAWNCGSSFVEVLAILLLQSFVSLADKPI